MKRKEEARQLQLKKQAEEKKQQQKDEERRQQALKEKQEQEEQERLALEVERRKEEEKLRAEKERLKADEEVKEAERKKSETEMLNAAKLQEKMLLEEEKRKAQCSVESNGRRCTPAAPHKAATASPPLANPGVEARTLHGRRRAHERSLCIGRRRSTTRPRASPRAPIDAGPGVVRKRATMNRSKPAMIFLAVSQFRWSDKFSQ